jgi:CubicO group peptidase (beta-lactamase class C family)
MRGLGRWVGLVCGVGLVVGMATVKGQTKGREQRDFSLRGPTDSQEVNREENASARSVRNDGVEEGEDPDAKPASGAPADKNLAVTREELDGMVRRVISEERVAGASVLVVRGGTVLLHAGYGFADLGLEAGAKGETVYHVVGPMLPFTGVAVMQLVERGAISLDDEITKFVPEFPMQGHRVTVRQLLNHTSGIVDYHYLGDAIEATSRQPKALDEVMALYAGKKWVNEPGAKWDWSISGFQLLVTIVERVSGESFAAYVQISLW